MGKPIEREMKGGESHTYEIGLTRGQYLNVIVDQRGIDVIEQIIAPDGKQVMEVNSPVGTKGPESVRLIAEASGKYRFVVRCLDKAAPAGTYEIRLMPLRDATQDDRRLQEAEKLDVEAMQLDPRKHYQEAVTILERTLAIREKTLGSENIEVTYSLNRLATLHQAQGDFAKAEVLLQRILAILEKALGPEHLLVATPLNQLATLYYKKGDYEKVEPLLQRGLAIYEKGLGSENTGVAYFLNNLAELYRTKGEYAKAEPLYERVLPMLEKELGTEHLLVATSVNNLAAIYFAKGDYAKAEPAYQRALAIYEKTIGIDNTEAAPSLVNLALLYENRGEFAKAELLLQRAVTTLERGSGPADTEVAASLNNLAALYDEKGDYVKSEPLLQRVLAIYQKALGPQHPNVAKTLNNLAKVSEEKGDYIKAESLYKRALVIYEKAFGSNHPDVASILDNLADILRSNGSYMDAESLFKRALSIYEKTLGLEHPDVAHLLNNLALLYQDKGHYVEAETLFKRAQIISARALGPEHPFVATVLSNLAVLYQRKEDIGNALTSLSRASDVREHDFLRNLISGSERQKLAYVAQSTHEADVAISWHMHLAPTSIDASRLACQAILRRKGRGLDAMADMIGSFRRHASGEDQKSLDQLANARLRLTMSTLKGPARTGFEQYRASLQALQDEAERLEGEISIRTAEFHVQSIPTTLDNVQKAVPPSAALVEFFSYRPFDSKGSQKDRYGKPHYVAYVLRTHGEPQGVELGDVESMDKKIDALRKALRDQSRKDLRQLARAVEKDVMEPVQRLLGGIHEVLLSPDGDLSLIPFAALVDERGRYLVKRYHFTYLSSGRDLLRLQKHLSSKEGMLIVADPSYGPIGEDDSSGGIAVQGTVAANGPIDFSKVVFPPLSGTEQEAEEIKKVMSDATVLVSKQATKAAVQQVNAPSILHIATHGFFYDDMVIGASSQVNASEMRVENPLLRSGLALAGANLHRSGDNEGILTALEVSALNLWGTKIVVLSACETGVGEVKNGDGVYGLRRALVLAGSESQMLSLWKVNDAGTRDFMTDYYARLKARVGRSEALRQAQLTVLASKARRHPYFWAGFIESGEWANLGGKR